MRFTIWNAHDSDAFREWRSRYADWPTREVFADPAYVRLFAAPRDEPLAAFAETDSGPILHPFILRPVDPAGPVTDTPPGTNAPPSTDSAPEYGPPAADPALAYDVTSAYGYAGAFTANGVDERDAKRFWAALDGFFRERGVVSEFTRLSLFDAERLPPPGPVEQKLTNVVCDLRVPEERLWRGFEHKVRKNVNRARRGGVEIEVDTEGRRLSDFLRIYAGTMRRRGAAAHFHFPRTFFEKIVHDLPGQFVFFHALHEGLVVSTELVLVSERSIYSYLGGTDAACFDLRPNDLLKFEVMRWARERGKWRYVLGGGYAPDDGIFRYKRAFAPDGLLPYHVASRVLDPQRYAGLVRAHLAEGRHRDPYWRPDAGFFPAYRCPLPPPPVPGAGGRLDTVVSGSAEERG